MKYFLLYFTAIVIFFAIDMIWLGWLASDLYNDNIGHLMAENVNWGAAMAFYALYLFGILYFAVIPSLKGGNWKKALIRGALFGLICYATYDLTNLATLRDFPLKVVVADLIWGTFITGTTAMLTYMAGTRWFHLGSV